MGISPSPAAARTIIGTTGSLEVVGLALAFTGLEPEPGVRRFATLDIQRGTVDNGRFAYQFQCQIVFDNDQGGFSGDTGIIGADVTYRISAADG